MACASAFCCASPIAPIEAGSTPFISSAARRERWPRSPGRGRGVGRRRRALGAVGVWNELQTERRGAARRSAVGRRHLAAAAVAQRLRAPELRLALHI
jgi:hypothetical protein